VAAASEGPKGRLHLHEDDGWAKAYYETGAPKARERLLFR
jgi:hypothetical protein